MKFGIFAALLFAGSLPLAGGPSAFPVVTNDPAVVERWRAGLKEVDQKLRDKQWEAAEKKARRVAYDIAEMAGTGEGASYSLAVASAFRAIAAAGLGHAEDAAWHWDAALNLFPDISKTNVSPYGPAGEELRSRKLREPESAEVLERAREVGTGKMKPLTVDPRYAGLDVTPPRIVKQPSPSFPKALSQMGTTGVVVVSAIIGVDGRPREPRVLDLEGGGPAMKYVALDAMREWRFEPAKLEGRPVAVFYVLTVNFRVKT